MFSRCFVVSLLIATLLTTFATSQSLTSGDITGVVTDPSGALISGANVSLTNRATSATETHATNAQGSYRFSLMSPGLYTLSISAPNLQTTKQDVAITVG
ncbi:MAG TPA: carboxypeptidase-like regulatory domain-containing protein, partial [Candidatus Sulfotelmatobacter sp.]|nr:carboxypeptidase-like regulatory domain-containing protein [Candidatus Sulfotelmatobacter sp.]